MHGVSILPKKYKTAACFLITFGIFLAFPVLALLPFYMTLSPMITLPHSTQLWTTGGDDARAKWPQWQPVYRWDFVCDTKEMVGTYVPGSPTGVATKQNIIDQFRASLVGQPSEDGVWPTSPPKEGGCPAGSNWREDTCPVLATLFAYLPVLSGQNISNNASHVHEHLNVTALSLCGRFEKLLPVPVKYNATVNVTVLGPNGTNVTRSKFVSRDKTDANGTIVTELACVMQGDLTLVVLPSRCYTGIDRPKMCQAPSKDQKEFFCVDPQMMASVIFVWAFYAPTIYLLVVVNALFALIA